MQPLMLQWNKCEGGQWCKLYGLDLEDEHFQFMAGVYIIWKDAAGREILRVGQGNIQERLYNHQWEDDIMAEDRQHIYVTWAGLDAVNRDGVLRFLLDVLKPKITDAKQPFERPVVVNLPWG